MTNQDANDLSSQGHRLFNQGRCQAAVTCYEQAANLARRAGQTSTELYALDGVAVCWGNLGEYNKMAESATRLLARTRQLANPKYEMQAALRLADALASIDLAGRWREIRPLLEEGLQTARQLGNDFWIVYHLMRLGGYAHQMEEWAVAYDWLQDALNALTPTTKNSAFFRMAIYQNLSKWYKGQNERAEALRYAEMAVGAAKEDSNPDFVVEAQLTQARVQQWRGERGEALMLVEEALTIARRIKNEVWVVESLALQVRLLADLGLAERAQVAYAELWALESSNPDRYLEIGAVAYNPLRDLAGAERAYRRYSEGRPTQPDGWCKLGLVLYDQGHLSEALHSWREALKIRNEHPEALTGLALGLWTQGQSTEAIKTLGEAAGLKARCIDPDYLREEWRWSDSAVEAIRSPLAAARDVLSLAQKGAPV
jgi:tetratricopeptide (TPR) repeat protein